MPPVHVIFAILILTFVFFGLAAFSPTKKKASVPMEPDIEDALDIVTLVDDAGVSHEFAVLEIVEVEGKEYALLVSAADLAEEAEAGSEDNDEEGNSILILRFEGDDLIQIEDDAEFQKIIEFLETEAPEEFEAAAAE